MTTITLSRPIRSGSLTISEVTLREPLVRDLIAGETAAAKGTRLDFIVAMLASVTGLTVEDVKSMSSRDFERINLAMEALSEPEAPFGPGGDSAPT